MNARFFKQQFFSYLLEQRQLSKGWCLWIVVLPIVPLLVSVIGRPQIVSGLLSIDAGELQVEGKVGGLIEISGGLGANLTDRENVLSRANMLNVPNGNRVQFCQQVQDFSELGEQFDDPVSTYSSGMKARLGFAISVSLTFDIMICDEALSAGDASFAAKCLAKVNELKHERIFILISHSMHKVQRFCQKGIVLNGGEVVFSGEITDAVAFYENYILHVSEAQVEQPPDTVASDVRREHDKSCLQPLLINREKVRDWQMEYTVDLGLNIDWRFQFQDKTLSNLNYRLGFPVFASDGTMLIGCAHEDLRSSGAKVQEMSGKLEIERHGLHPGVYHLVVALYEGMEPILRQIVEELKVLSNGEPYFGVFEVEHRWLIDQDF